MSGANWIVVACCQLNDHTPGNKMKSKSLAIYFILLVLLCTAFIIEAQVLGEQGTYLAQGYMLIVIALLFLTKEMKSFGEYYADAVKIELRGRLPIIPFRLLFDNAK